MMQRHLTVVCFVALIVRFAMIAWFLSGAYVTPQPFLSLRYFQEGYAISAGWGYSTGTDDDYAKSTPVQQQVERGENNGGSAVARPPGFYAETLHPPGMSLLVAVMHRLFGGPALIPVMIFGAILDVLTALIVFVMTKSILGERVALISALTYALFLPQAYASTAALSPDGLESFFVVAGFAFMLHGLRAFRGHSYVSFAIAGVLFGIGGYFRPDYDLIAIGLVPFLWLYLRSLRRAAAVAGVIFAVTYATLLPYAYRNHRLYDRWIFTSTAVGSTMVEGLGEFRNPWGFTLSDVDLQRQARAKGYTSAYSPDGSDYFTRVFLAAIREHPIAYAASVAKRLPLALAPAFQFGFQNPLKTRSFAAQRESGIDRYQAIRSNPVYVVGAYWDALLFAGASALFLVCSIYMLWAERRRWQLVALLLGPHIYGIGVHLVSELEPRYLLPSMFSLMIGFAYCMQASIAKRAVQMR